MAKKTWRDYSEVVEEGTIPTPNANPMIPQEEMEVYSDPSLVKSLVKGAGEAIVDSAIVLPQATSIETLDKGISAINPELGEAYKSAVDASRERSPIATTFTELLSPNPINKVIRGGKLAGAAVDAATSAIYQGATEGEVDPEQVAVDTVAGRILGKTASTLVGDRKANRAKLLNLGDIKELRKKGRGRADSYVDSLLDDLESTELFAGGVVDSFDTATGKFGGTAGIKDKVKQPFLPPSAKEMRDRTIMARQTIGSEIEDIILKNSSATPGGAPAIGMDANQVVNDPEIARWINSYPNRGNNPREKALQETLESMFADSPGVPATVFEINAEKRRLYDLLAGDYGKVQISNPDRQAKIELANILKNKVEQGILDPAERGRYQRLNGHYETFATIGEPLSRKIEKQYATGGSASITPYGSPEYRAYTTAQSLVPDTSGVRSQTASSYEMGNPLTGVRGMSDSFRSRVTPMIQGGMSEDPSVNENNRYTPMNRAPQSSTDAIFREVKIPRSTEGFLENKDVLIQKVARFQPDMLPQAMEIANLPVEEIQDQLPLLVTMFPQLFEPDKYGRVDGIIIDPVMQEKARKDLEYDTSLTNVQKAIYLNKLNQSGKLEGY